MTQSPIEPLPLQPDIDLTSLSGYESFGAMLKTIRTRHGITQQQFAEMSKTYFRSRKLPTLTFRICSALEKGKLRAPHFEELEPIYLTLTDAEGFNIRLSPKERELFVILARKRIEEKQKQKEVISSDKWEKLAERLAQLDGSRRSKIYLLPKREESDQAHFIESNDSRRLKALHDILHTDTSHLLERKAWLERMLSYLTVEQQRKLVVVQGHMGIGKSHALALLTQHLASQPDYYLIPYRFSPGEGKTSEDQLDTFLATLQSDLLGSPVTDTMKQPPLAERMEQVLSAIKQRGKVVLFLDDAQEIFSSATEWPSAWQQFFLAFVKEPHNATIFLATRLWPGWPERRLTYIEQTELSPLSLEGSVRLWKRVGFSDVPEQLLLRASERCGGNPQVIEMKAASLKRPGFTFSWKTTKGKHDLLPSNRQENEHTTLIKRLLGEDAIFTDISSRRMLTQVITGRLSHQATRMLEMLAVSPLGLPFSLLDEEFRDFEVAYDELVRASLVDLGMAVANRAAVVPLVREAQIQALVSDGRLEGIEARITDLYAHWLHEVQDYRDDAEQAALIAEMVVRYMRQRQLLKAAELFTSFGWLCVLFGHVTRIQRVYHEVITEDRGQEEDVKHEIGRLLLQHRIAVSSGQKFERAERDRMYQSIHEKVVAGEVDLRSHSELEVLHNMRLCYARKAQFIEASQMFDKAIERLQQSGQLAPEVHASFLFESAQLHLSWSEHEAGEQHPSEALHHVQIAANTLRESITRWRLCLKIALPLQEHYVNFELARALNDYGYVLRELGRYQEAQQAIEESIRLKKSNAALPHSIAIALSELSQILLRQGMIQQAKILNGEAVQLLEKAVEDGDSAHQPELGMLLVERADILWQQAQLAEALPLLERAVLLIGDKPSRQQYKQQAKKQIDEIRLITSSGHTYQLDRRWFSRYSELVAYDDLFLLTQAGPFTEDEQEEWAKLFPHRGDEESKNRLLALAAQSRKRESTRSLQEGGIPVICYPCLLPEDMVEDLQERSHGLAELRRDIEKQEKNVVVRRLYLDAIEEQLAILRLMEAVVSQDQETAWQSNLQLYGKPSEREVKIALQALYATLSDARHNDLAESVAREITAQLKAWNLSLFDIASEELFLPQQERDLQEDCGVLIDEKRQFPTGVVRVFFQDVLSAYGADDWKVSISPARDYTYVNPNERRLVLPQKTFSVGKIRQLLAEEVETHTFRALAGQRSSLALLGLGLARQEATEEGLAKWYIKHVNQRVGVKQQENTWIGTLATGLAAGILTPMLSFQELRSFLEKYYLVHRLLEKEESQEESLVAAKLSAWARVCRTFRGIPDLSQPGCSLKDGVYLRGHLEVSRYFECGGDEQRLWVGAVGIEHLEDLAELNILAPNFPHRHFALAPDLPDQLSRYDKKVLSTENKPST